MRIRTDDEVYRVDAVWLGPPKATFPFRARYVAWAIAVPLFFIVIAIERWMGIGLGFFSVAWAVIVTIVLTRLIGAKINHERPLGATFAMWGKELGTPRERVSGDGGAVSVSKVKMRAERPLPKVRQSKRNQVVSSRRRESTQRNTPRGRRNQPAAWR